MAQKRANGEGSIYPRADGRWEASVTLDATGRRRWFIGRTRLDVEQKLDAALATRRAELAAAAAGPLLAQFLETWLNSARPALRPRTFTRYEQYVRLHIAPALGATPITQLAAQQLQQLYAARLEAGLSATTVHHVHAVLHRALHQAERWSLVPRNVADLVDPPRSYQPEITTLSREQAQALLSAARTDRLEALYVLALTTGMRQGELLALRWRDVDLDTCCLHVRGTLQRSTQGLAIGEPKTRKSRRRIELSTAGVEALFRHRERQHRERVHQRGVWQEHDLVFANEVGRPMEAGNLIRRSFRPLLRSAGLPRIRFHDLRHTAATLLMGQNVPPKVVSEMLGHSQVGITLDLYSHVTPTMQRQATAAMDALLQT